MSRNESEGVEKLGNWDHGVVVDDPLKGPSSPKVGFREALVAAEHTVEGAIRGVLEEKKRMTGQEEVCMVEALGEWDHGVCDPEIKDSGEVQDIRQFVLAVERKADLTVRKMIQKGAQAISIDDRTKKQIAEHTEEEVLGVKLCVNGIVRDASFETP